MSRPVFTLLCCCFLLQIATAQKKLIPFTDGEKWGYCDEKVKLIIPLQYDRAYPFFEDRALVVNYNYEVAENASYVDAAFINQKGEVIFKLNSSPQAAPASRFQRGVAIVENYNHTEMDNTLSLSIVDKTGKELQRIENAALDFELSMYYESGIPFNKHGVYTAINAQTGLAILVFEDGRAPVQTNYTTISKFHNGFAIAFGDYDDASGDYGTILIDSTGREVIPRGQFDMVWDYDNGNLCSEGLICFKKEEKFGFINLAGEIVIEPVFDSAEPFSEGMAVVGQSYVEEGEYSDLGYFRYGYIDVRGNLKIDYKYDYAAPFSEGLAEVSLIEDVEGEQIGKLVFIDTSGSPKFSFDAYLAQSYYNRNHPFESYVYRHGFQQGKMPVYKYDKIGFINKKGETIIPAVYYGLGRVGPSSIVEPFENGITKLVNTSNYIYTEIYIDTAGTQYYIPLQMALPSRQKSVRIYSEPNFNKAIDTLKNKEPKYIVSILPKKVKRNGQKGYWIELKEVYEEEKYFAFSTDFIAESLLTTAKEGTKVFLYPDPDSEALSPLFAPNTILFLHEQENPGKIGKKGWLRVYYCDTENYENRIGIGYVRAADVKKYK